MGRQVMRKRRICGEFTMKWGGGGIRRGIKERRKGIEKEISESTNTGEN